MDARDARKFRSVGRLCGVAVAVALWLGSAMPAGAAAAKLVKDIERSSRLCETSELVRAGDALYFGTPDDCRGGIALWRSDGSFPGTHTVGSFVAGTKGLRRVQPLLAIGDVLYFGVTQGQSFGWPLVELWRTDGSDAGTSRVYEFAPDSGIAHHTYPPATEAVIDGKLLFFVADGSTLTPWVSDGTGQGTHALADVGVGSLPVKYLESGGLLYFVAGHADGYGLFRTDGTVGGTLFLHDLGVPNEDDASVLPEVAIGPDAAIWFAPTVSRNQREVWRTEGTPATTSRVAGLPFAATWALVDGVHVVLEARRGVARVSRLDPASGALAVLVDFTPPPLGFNGLDVVARRDGVLFFMADIARPGEEPALWRTDGTVGGTFALLDGWAYGEFFPVGNGFVFRPDPEGWPELWYTDGTVAGTARLLGRSDSFGYGGFVPLGDELLFADDRGDFHADLLRTDGTVAGTTSVRSLPGMPSRVGTLGDVALLHIDGTLWRSDGTPDGTYPLRELGVWTWGSWPWQLTDVDGTLFFAVAGREGTANEIWRSDGTRGGTTLVADFPDGDDDLPLLMTAFGDRLLFRRGARQLWRSDGTPGGTAMIVDVSDGDPQTVIRDIHPHAGAAYVSVGNASATDGTLLRVNGAATLAEPVASLAASSLTSFDDGVFFSAPSAPETAAVWRSDGTSGGTATIATFSALNRRRRPEIGKLLPAADEMYFSVARSGRTALWRTDGTAQGTARVAELPVAAGTRGKVSVGDGAFLDDVLVFSFPTDDGNGGGPNLWRSDGTEAGTHQLAAIYPFSRLTSFTVANGKVFFISPSPYFPSALWVTDGTDAGTKLLNDRVLDGWLVGVGDEVYYCGLGIGVANELWRSDGTMVGTVPVYGRNNGCLGAPAASGGRLFFAFDAPRYGPELWSLPLVP
jgi:ELWxxDGT repeat protein